MDGQGPAGLADDQVLHCGIPDNGARCGAIGQPVRLPPRRVYFSMASSSTSKVSVALGGTALPAPREP